MNDISFNEHKGFSQEWKIVTIRYRTDVDEIRVTYANDVAFKTLAAMKPNYPDGSKFGKVTFTTTTDAAFVSSNMPSGISRFQLMVKDSKKYAETNGWGYALFDENGRLFNEDLKEKTIACAACHSLVPERGYVFSRSYHHINSGSVFETLSKSDKLYFKQVKPKELKGSIQEHLTKNSKWVESLEGVLKQHAFSGTLDETVPLLIDRTKKMRKDSVLFVDEKNYTYVKVLEDKDQCTEGKKKYLQIFISFNGGLVRDAKGCY